MLDTGCSMLDTGCWKEMGIRFRVEAQGVMKRFGFKDLSDT
jgi:hypothetical protein